MKLPIPFLKNKETESKYYLALLFEDEKIASAVLEEEEGKLKIVGTGNENLSSSLELLSKEELISTVDRAISKAEEILPPNIETHKTVFGVKGDWVEKETKKIKKEYLSKLKKVCESLDLTPIGFMVTTEAITNLLQSEEGAPLSAIFIDIDKKRADLVLFRGGQAAETVSGDLNEDMPASVDGLLKKFTAPVLPAKIVVAQRNGIKNIASQLTNHNWSKSLPFLHVPQVTLLPQEFSLKAIIFGAATQLGLDVLGLHTLSAAESPVKELHQRNHDEKSYDGVNDGETFDSAKSESATANFGFIAEEDIAEKLPEEPDRDDADQEESLSKDELGEKEKDEKMEMSSDAYPAHDKEYATAAINNSGSHRKPKDIKRLASGLLSPVAAFYQSNFPKFAALLGRNKKLKLALMVAGIALLLITGSAFSYFYNARAEVILSVNPRIVSQTEQVVFSTNAGSDFSKNIIAANTISADLDGETSTDATGKKDVGEKAKGTVTIYNSDNRRIELSSGTEIESSNGLTFTLDKNVSVASASGDIFSGTKPGTADVEATAKEIGKESNLPSNTRFTIGGNSALAAKNDNAFSGGSKETITVVSDKDLTRLRTDLQKKLEGRAKEELSKQAKNNTLTIPVILEVSFTDEKFDKKVDAEAKQVKLAATLSFTSLTYGKSQLEDFAKSIMKDKYTDDIAIAEDSLKIDIKNPEKEDENEVGATLEIKAGLLPEIDTKEVAQKIKNKSPREVKAMLNALPQVRQTQIKYSPNVFFVSGLLPKLPNNISVSVKAE
jgi:hypothetical protein